jgi:hypothetical protein
MKKRLLVISMAFILIGCGGKKNNPTPPGPSKATLSSPAQNAVCTNGTVLTDSTSSISFKWSTPANTDSYELYIKNLLTGVMTTQSTNATQLSVILSRNTPYSWYVISKSSQSNTTAQTDAWKFYNAGKGAVTYAPFPAEITSPTYGQNVTPTAGKLTVTWIGSSVNPGTIVNYDVYLGTAKTPPLLKGAVTNSSLIVDVTPVTAYYWKVITRDFAGNTSDSGVFQFKVL